MFGLGIGELLLIVVLALLLFGGTRIPKVARSLRLAALELRGQVTEETQDAEAKKLEDARDP